MPPPTALKALIFDWAGTTVDFGSLAPARVFLEIFRACGVEITIAEARQPMGRAKRDHIAAILEMPRVARLWCDVHGAPPGGADVERMYADFLPLQKAALRGGADVIPGVVGVVAECRRMGLRIGSTTGYTRELMDVVCPIARQGGYEPDVVVCADEVAAGRPAPWMNFRAAEQLGVYPMDSIAAIDDTPVGIAAGRNAGMWTVAVAASGNGMGLSEGELAALPVVERQQRLAALHADFLGGGAHYVVDSVAELLPVLDRIQQRLQQGERP